MKPLRLTYLKNGDNASQSLWQIEDNYVVVSRIIAFNRGGWETLIFKSDIFGNIEDYTDLYCSYKYETHEKSMANYIGTKE
jgi:hypothetical protein